MLTDNIAHMTYESLSEAEMHVIMKRFEEMVKLDKIMDEDDIISIFSEENRHIYERWFNNAEFAESLTEFNKRKDYFKTLGLDGFMDKYQGDYGTLYSRFYKNHFDKDNNRYMMYVVANPAARNYSDLLAIDFYLSKNPDLLDYFARHESIFINWFGD